MNIFEVLATIGKCGGFTFPTWDDANNTAHTAYLRDDGYMILSVYDELYTPGYEDAHMSLSLVEDPTKYFDAYVGRDKSELITFIKQGIAKLDARSQNEKSRPGHSRGGHPMVSCLPDEAKNILGNLTPEEVLYDFDGPRIFTCRTPNQELLLAFLYDLHDSNHLYMVVPTNRTRIESLKSGKLSLREALEQPWIWQVEVRDGNILLATKVELETLPEDVLPNPGVLLWHRVVRP